MKRAFRVSRNARRDIDRIWTHHSQFGTDVADRLIDRLLRSTRRLLDFPLSAPVLPGSVSTLRKLSAHGHIMLYRANDDGIVLTRVFSARQDWLAELDGDKP